MNNGGSLQSHAALAYFNRMQRHTLGLTNCNRLVGTLPTGERGDEEEPASATLMTWNGSRFILTVKHAVERAVPGELRFFANPLGSVEIRANNSDLGTLYEGERPGGGYEIHRSSCEDLAIVTWPNLTAPHVEFFDVRSSNAEPEPGERVVGYGYPGEGAIEVERRRTAEGNVRVARALSAAAWDSSVMTEPTRLLSGYQSSRHYLVEWDSEAMKCAPYGYSGSAVWRVPRHVDGVWHPQLVFLGVASHFYATTKAERVTRPTEVLRFIREVFG